MPPTDVEIAQQTRILRVTDLARDRLGISGEHLVPCGHHKARISLACLDLADAGSVVGLF